jgi:hypothetical protein
MRKLLSDLLKSYLMGWKTLGDCLEWFASIDWNDKSIDRETSDLVNDLELVATEISEGLRPEVEFWSEVSKIVNQETESMYVMQPTPYLVTSSTTNRSIDYSGITNPEVLVLQF